VFFYSRLVVESTSLNDLVVNIELESSTLVHGLNTFLGYKTQNEHGTRLVDTILSLQIGMWVPIRVKAEYKYQFRKTRWGIGSLQDNCVSGLQIETKTPSSRRQSEDHVF
jgi:hypothetical protein